MKYKMQTAYVCTSILHHTPCNTLAAAHFRMKFALHARIHLFCNTLLYTATHCNTLHISMHALFMRIYSYTLQHAHCNTLQHTHCNTLQHARYSHARALHAHIQLQQTATHYVSVCMRSSCTHMSIYCNTRAATHCNTLQHTATHYV